MWRAHVHRRTFSVVITSTPRQRAEWLVEAGQIAPAIFSGRAPVALRLSPRQTKPCGLVLGGHFTCREAGAEGQPEGGNQAGGFEYSCSQEGFAALLRFCLGRKAARPANSAAVDEMIILKDLARSASTLSPSPARRCPRAFGRG